MKCEEALNLISEYILNELPNDKAIQLKSHLDQCNKCKEEYLFQLELKYELERDSKEISNSYNWHKIKNKILNSIETKKVNNLTYIFKPAFVGLIFLLFLSTLIWFSTKTNYLSSYQTNSFKELENLDEIYQFSYDYGGIDYLISQSDTLFEEDYLTEKYYNLIQSFSDVELEYEENFENFLIENLDESEIEKFVNFYLKQVLEG